MKTPVHFYLDGEEIVSIRMECIPREGESFFFKSTDKQLSSYVVSAVGHIFEETAFNEEEQLSSAEYHVNVILERLKEYGINLN